MQAVIRGPQSSTFSTAILDGDCELWVSLARHFINHLLVLNTNRGSGVIEFDPGSGNVEEVEFDPGGMEARANHAALITLWEIVRSHLWKGEDVREAGIALAYYLAWCKHYHRTPITPAIPEEEIAGLVRQFTGREWEDHLPKPETPAYRPGDFGFLQGGGDGSWGYP